MKFLLAVSSLISAIKHLLLASCKSFDLGFLVGKRSWIDHCLCYGSHTVRQVHCYRWPLVGFPLATALTQLSRWLALSLLQWLWSYAFSHAHPCCGVSCIPHGRKTSRLCPNVLPCSRAIKLVWRRAHAAVSHLRRHTCKKESVSKCNYHFDNITVWHTSLKKDHFSTRFWVKKWSFLCF